MAMLGREDVLSAKRRHEVVAVPEWGGDVCVWEMSARQRLTFEQDFAELDPDARLAALVRFTVGDESGPFVPPLDLERLRDGSASAVMRIYGVALRLNVIGKEATEEVLGE